jgi:hypothetical protein
MVDASDSGIATRGDDADYVYSTDEVLVEQTKCQMVLGSLERCLAERIIKNINQIELSSGPASKAYAVFKKTYNREPKSKEELIRKSYIDHLLGIAKFITRNQPEQRYYERLIELFNALQLFSTRSNTYAHTANKYLPVYWARAQALALDPVILQLGFLRVLERHDKAVKGEIILDEILSESEYALVPNNLPRPDFDKLYGRDSTLGEIKDFVLNPRKPSICIYGAGGTGKTACALSVLNDICVSEIGHINFDLVLTTSLKDEFLEYGLLRREDVDATWDGVKRQLISEFRDLSEDDERLPSFTPHEDSIVSEWASFVTTLAEKRVLIWIDNLETLQTDLHEGFASLEESLPREWKVLITSRIRVRDTSKVISLAELDPNSAARFFLDEFRSQLSDDISFAQAKEYAESLYCNPLAIRNAISYHRRTGRDIGESIAAGRDAIVSFSYRNLISTLSDEARVLCEVLFAFTSASKYDLASYREIQQDLLIAGLLELQDLALVLPTSKGEGKYTLSDNFRGYLSLFPISIDERQSAVDSAHKNAEIHAEATKKDLTSANRLSFEYIGSATRENAPIYQKTREAISTLRVFYNSKETGKIASQEVTRTNLRQHLKELDDIAASVGPNAFQHPEIFRLIGLIYQEFVDVSNCNKYLSKATELGDANAALTQYYNAAKKNEKDFALVVGYRLIDIMGNKVPNDKRYIKFMTSFLSLLKEKDKIDEVIDLCGDWHESGRYANFFLAFLASAYCTKGRSATPSFGNKDTLRTQCEWFTLSLDYLERALQDLSGFDRQVVRQTFLNIRDISGFIKQSACLGINLPYIFLDRSLKFFEDYWSDSFRRIQTHNNSNIDISSGVTESILGIFDELRQILQQTERGVKGKCVEVDLSSMKWAQTRISALTIVRFAGFENSLAVMVDPAAGTTFSLHCTTYNDAYANNTNLPEWSSLAINDVIHCVVFTNYITRESKRDRVRSVVAASG